MNNLTYIRYSRKSSEAKEKQALSIKDQNKECDDLSFREGLKIKYKLEEAKTAFKPNKRAQFSLMVELVKSGKANAILTWKPDRICRNPLAFFNCFKMASSKRLERLLETSIHLTPII